MLGDVGENSSIAVNSEMFSVFPDVSDVGDMNGKNIAPDDL